MHFLSEKNPGRSLTNANNWNGETGSKFHKILFPFQYWRTGNIFQVFTYSARLIFTVQCMFLSVYLASQLNRFIEKASNINIIPFYSPLGRADFSQHAACSLGNFLFKYCTKNINLLWNVIQAYTVD